MKCRILISICTIWIYQTGWAQNIDRVYPGWDEIVEIRERDNSGFLLITRDLMMHSVDAQGNLQQSYAIDPQGQTDKAIISVFDDFAEQDSIFYVSTFDDHCDYYENQRLYKLDTSGNVIEEIFLHEEWIFSSGTFVYPETPGGPKYIFPASMEVVVWYNTDSIETITVDNYIEQLEINQNGDFAILTSREIFYYIGESGQFSLSNKILLGNHHFTNDNFFFTSANDLLWSTEKSIVLFNQQLDTISHFRPPTSEKFIFIKESRSQLIAVTVDEGSNMKIYLLDPDLTVQLSRETGFKGLQLSDVVFLTDSLLTFTGIEFYEDDKWFPFIKDFSFAVLPPMKRNDLSISDVKYDYIQLLGDHDCFGYITNMYRLKNAVIEIANYGSELIDEVSITPKNTYCGLWCDPPVAIGQIELNQMNLLPGESKIFAVGDMSIRTASQSQLCLVTILPDLHVDADHQGNTYCFDIITGLSNTEQDEVVLFYPNPNSGTVYFNLPENEKLAIIIYDVNGQTIFKERIYDSTTGIDLKGISSGIYFIKMISSKGDISTAKLIRL